MAWGNKQEQRRRELQQELAVLDTERSEAMDKLVKVMDAAMVKLTPNGIAALIRDADAIRDALEPFDSGVRKVQCQEVAKPTGYDSTGHVIYE